MMRFFAEFILRRFIDEGLGMTQRNRVRNNSKIPLNLPLQKGEVVVVAVNGRRFTLRQAQGERFFQLQQGVKEGRSHLRKPLTYYL
jgi:hypothetical protein